MFTIRQRRSRKYSAIAVGPMRMRGDHLVGHWITPRPMPPLPRRQALSPKTRPSLISPARPLPQSQGAHGPPQSVQSLTQT
ncbi:hypothetical protein DPMN_104504 [Dreissena polymorpha]|uniref:Uncharacterized protein n=1 Tax=Dreissena polymorpha TaxID=45954 RepID=A0A9D4HFS8_DREPO|nr:hypothetical protein DPMN_104504 [Dreissena polymorpha]